MGEHLSMHTSVLVFMECFGVQPFNVPKGSKRVHKCRVHTCVFTCARACTCMQACARTCMPVYVHVCICAHVYALHGVCVCTRVLTAHTCLQVCTAP